MLAKLFLYPGILKLSFEFQLHSTGQNWLEESPKIAKLFFGGSLFTLNHRNHSIRILNVQSENEDQLIIF